MNYHTKRTVLGYILISPTIIAILTGLIYIVTHLNDPVIQNAAIFILVFTCIVSLMRGLAILTDTD